MHLPLKANSAGSRVEAGRVMRALEAFAVAGRGDVKALKGELNGRYRLRVGRTNRDSLMCPRRNSVEKLADYRIFYF